MIGNWVQPDVEANPGWAAFNDVWHWTPEPLIEPLVITHPGWWVAH